MSSAVAPLAPISTRAVILLQLWLHGPRYGSEIMASVSQTTSERFKLHCGSVYPTLGALEKEGLVSASVPEGRGRTCYYTLTASGRQMAEDLQQIIRLVAFKAGEEPCPESAPAKRKRRATKKVKR